MRLLAGLAALVVLAGCAGATAQVTIPSPAPTATASPSPTPAPVPTATPVGTGADGPPACTGSMAPALTSLDRVAKHGVTSPAQIAIGDVVSFETRACWLDGLGLDYALHRVIAIREGESGTEYLTQGDANPEPDCWMPFSAIREVVVGVRKNVYPANKPLFDAMQLVRNAAIQASAAYLDDTEAVCGHRDPAKCAPPLGAARDKGMRLWERAEATRVDHECWMQKARLSEYPGHIPQDVCQSLSPVPMSAR